METANNTYTAREILLPKMHPQVIARQIGDFVIERVKYVNSTGCVIGLSGGIDSTTTAALIKNAFDTYNSRQTRAEDRLEIVGYILPSSINNPDDTKDGLYVASWLGIRHEVIDISPVIEIYRTTNPEAFKSDCDRGNLTSRIRANILSTKAATEKKIIAGTGNKDEDFGVGYYTLFGDGAVHMSPIAGLSKRLVRQMAQYLGVDNRLVNREPTAGLEIGQTDFKDLGYGYDVVELVMEARAQGFSYEDIKENRQIYSLVKKQIAMQENPRFYDIGGVVDDIFKRNKMAIAKSEIIHPPTPDISLYY